MVQYAFEDFAIRQVALVCTIRRVRTRPSKDAEVHNSY